MAVDLCVAGSRPDKQLAAWWSFEQALLRCAALVLFDEPSRLQTNSQMRLRVPLVPDGRVYPSLAQDVRRQFSRSLGHPIYRSVFPNNHHAESTGDIPQKQVPSCSQSSTRVFMVVLQPATSNCIPAKG